MKVSGTAVLHGPVETVYAVLNDPAVLVRTIPGCERLEQAGADAYRATVTAGVASIKGSFSGAIRLSDQRPPHSLVLCASGAGAPGTVSADVTVTLAENGDGTTLLSYDADAVVGGMIGGVGQRVLASVAKKTAGEFFSAVDAVLTGEPAPVAAPPPVQVPVRVPVQAQAPAPAPVGAPPAGTQPTATPEPAGTQAAGGQPQPSTQPLVYTRPPAPAPAGQRSARDLVLGLVSGAGVTLLGALVGGLRPDGDFALGVTAGAGVALLGAVVGGLVAGRR
ncbi:SRPBCC family protein [Micromonospora sp. MS34]|uniref:SRPBCC family protein n=1 Tax=Micromonospora sp. MS34 TaxID=3385971 RepID=UPI00399F934D